jgi:hypothetical protein
MQLAASASTGVLFDIIFGVLGITLFLGVDLAGGCGNCIATTSLPDSISKIEKENKSV